MRLPAYLALAPTLLLAHYVLANPSYFIINSPSKGAQWVNGNTNYATWTTGVGQGIDTFDVELARLSTDGLLFVARNVPTSAKTLPITLTDVPPADDYFLLFLNSTHGVMHSMSQRFSILPASQSTTNSSTGASKPPGKNLIATVSISGAPNPTSSFAYTFAPTAGARPARRVWRAGAALAALAGCLWAVW